MTGHIWRITGHGACVRECSLGKWPDCWEFQPWLKPSLGIQLRCGWWRNVVRWSFFLRHYCRCLCCDVYMARWSSVGQTRITPRRRFSPWRTLASTEWSTTGWIRTGLTLLLLQREGKLQHPFLHQNWVCLKTQVGWPHIRLWLKWRVWRFCRFYVTRPSPIASRGLATETKGSKTTEQLELQWAAHVIKEMTCWYTTFRKTVYLYI